MELTIRNIPVLNANDKVVFKEKKENLDTKNTFQVTLLNIQNRMKGQAEKVGLRTEDDVVAYIKDLRKTRWGFP